MEVGCLEASDTQPLYLYFVLCLCMGEQQLKWMQQRQRAGSRDLEWPCETRTGHARLVLTRDVTT